MKIAVTAKGRNLSAESRSALRPAAYIVIVDTETLDYELLTMRPTSMPLRVRGFRRNDISERGVGGVAHGYCGRCLHYSRSCWHQVGSDTVGTVAEAVENFQKEASSNSDAPNAEGQW